MKTIREWLNELPDPYKWRALTNERFRKNTHHWDSSHIESMLTALDCAFDWEITPEGKDYWEFIYNKIKSGELNNTPQPNWAKFEVVEIILSDGSRWKRVNE